MSLRINPTPLSGVLLIEPAIARDERGSFTRLTCGETLRANGVAFTPLQTSLSRSARTGTLRGMHYQTGEAGETKVVHCVAGTIFDVALDLRPASVTFRQWFGIELSAGSANGLLIPPGCAHGLLALTDNVAVLYEIDRGYDPAAASGVRWNDPAFAIAWPMAPSLLSDRDANWPDYQV